MAISHILYKDIDHMLNLYRLLKIALEILHENRIVHI